MFRNKFSLGKIENSELFIKAERFFKNRLTKLFLKSISFFVAVILLLTFPKMVLTYLGVLKSENDILREEILKSRPEPKLKETNKNQNKVCNSSTDKIECRRFGAMHSQSKVTLEPKQANSTSEDTGIKCVEAMWENSKFKMNEDFVVVNKENKPIRRKESYDFEINPVLAETSCISAIKKYPDEGLYEYNLARTYYSLKRYELAVKHFEESISKRYLPAYSKLGYMYGGGKLGESNANKAFELFTAGAKAGHVDSKVGQAHYLQFGFGDIPRDINQAKILLDEAYTEKSAEAAYRLGYFYRKGFGGEIKAKEAFARYQDAVRWGKYQGYVRMSDMLFDGDLELASVDQDKQAFSLLQKAIDKDDTPSAYNSRGWAFEKGRGVSKNSSSAIANYASAIERRNGYGAINLGKLARFGLLGLPRSEQNVKDYFNQAIDLGVEDGFIYLADMLVDGDFKPKSDINDKKALSLIETAIAKTDSVWGTRYKAWMMLYGKGVSKNEAVAKMKFEELLDERRDGWSAVYLGNIYRDGLSVNIDLNKAKQYYTEAVDLGIIDAKYRIAWLSLGGRDGPITRAKDQAAVIQLEQAAFRKSLNAMNDLGWVYENGYGVDRDVNFAKKQYEFAEVLGSGISADNLGNMYQGGIFDTGKDYAIALKYYQNAIKYGRIEAYSQIASMLYDEKVYSNENGNLSVVRPIHLTKNQTKIYSDKKAFELLEDAHKGNGKHTATMTWLAWAHNKGRGTEVNHRKSIAYSEKASNLGSTFASKKLAVRYFLGDGVERNITRANEYLNIAANLGDISSIRALLWIAEGNGFADTEIKFDDSNCSEATDLHKQLLVSLGRSRSISGVFDLFEDQIDGLTYVWPPGIDESPCDIASLKTNKAQIIVNYMKFIAKNKLATNPHSLSVLLDKTENYIENNTGSLDKSRIIIDEVMNWMLEKLDTSLLHDDPRATCMRLRVQGVLFGSEKSLEGFLSLLSTEADLSKYNYFCNFSDFTKLLEHDELEYDKDAVRDKLEMILEFKGKLNDEEELLLDMQLFAFGSELGNRSFLDDVDLISDWNNLSYRIAEQILTDEKKSENFRWAGKVIGKQVIYGNLNAEQYIAKKYNYTGKDFWRGVQTAFVDACIYSDAVDGIAGKSTWSAFKKARGLGLDARTRLIYPENGEPRFLRADYWEYWSYCE